MPTIAHTNVPAPKSWDEFEDIILSAAKLRWSSTDFFRHGRAGQAQHGVDVYGHDAEGRQIGVQGKNTNAGLSQTILNEEVAKAESFEPPLAALYIATTARRDTSIQEYSRKLSEMRRQAGKFPVLVLFWEDIVQDLSRNEDEFFKHYPQLRSSASINLAKEHDRKLYETLTTLLSSKGAIGFVDETNMAGWAFEKRHLDPLYEFYHTWNTPEREFLNTVLETLRKQLWQKISGYLTLIAYETFPCGSGLQSVPSEWEIEQPERFTRVVGELHTLAGEIVELHAKIVREGRLYLLGTT